MPPFCEKHRLHMVKCDDGLGWHCPQCESGAPLQPGATQPEHDGVTHETKKDCNEFTMQGAAQNLRALAEMTTGKLYSHSELTTLLERMARLVVEEAANEAEGCQREGKFFTDEKRPPVQIYNDAVCEVADVIKELFHPGKTAAA